MCQESQRHRKGPQLGIVVFLLVLLAALPAQAGRLSAEQAPAAGSDHVEVFEGDMPLLFAVGHGGWEQVGDLKNASHDWVNDVLVQEYFNQILLVRIYQKTGHLPYVVYQQGMRNYVNTNRPVDHPEAYNADNPEAKAAYLEFHNQVDTLVGHLEARYGADMGLLINPHSTDLSYSRHDKPWDRIADIGIIARLSNLGSSSNTMKSLYDRRGTVALQGEDSILYQLFHAQDWPSPSAVWPAAADINSKTLAQTGDDVWHVLPAYVTGWGVDAWVDSYYNGYSTIMYHGTNTWGHHGNWANGLDAFQMEVNYIANSGISLSPSDPRYDPEGPYHQLDVAFTARFMDDLADAILYSLQVNYGWTPGGVYNVVVDNGEAAFSTTGTWQPSVGNGSWGTQSIFTDEVGATARWWPSLAQAGTYQVFIRWTDTGTRSPDVQYRVDYAGGSDTFVVDQGGVQSAKWVSLGQFYFSAGSNGGVTLTCTGTGNSTAADAVLFRLVTQAPVQLYLPAVFR